MFSSKKKQPPIRSLVGEGTAVHGELHFSEGLRIDGEVHGDVIAEEGKHSLLVISEKACVRGKVIAGHVIINGEIIGPVECRDLLELQPKARITGDVTYASLEMHQGATIAGAMRPRVASRVEPSSQAGEDKPGLKLATSNQPAATPPAPEANPAASANRTATSRPVERKVGQEA